MTPEQVLAALGIPWRFSFSFGLRLDRRDEIGDPPTFDAALVRDGVSVLLLVKPSRTWDAALHEAVHAMLGPSSLDDESALMAVEYAVCSELAEPWRSSWRRNFADYGLPWETSDGRLRFEIGAANRAPIGQSEEFTRSKEWRRCVALAEQAGFLDLGRVVWGHGPSPAWSDYEG